MRIAHIVSTYPPYYGGMGNVVWQMAERLGARGHEVEVFTTAAYESKELRQPLAPSASSHSPELKEAMATVRRLAPTLRYGNAARLPQLRRELAEADLVHLHYPFFGTANLVRRFKFQHPDKPLVITYHMDTRGPGWLGLIFKYYSRYWMPKILGAADRLIVSSFDYLEHSAANAVYRSQPGKWIELPFGVDTKRFAPRAKPLALYERHNLNPDVPTILFVGGMDAAHYFKGIPTLLEALWLLKRNGGQFQAVLVGDGDRRPDHERQAEGLGLSGGVRFVGRASEAELPSYYNLADVFVLPSIHQGEAFGMVLLEAMASGVPVIASDLPGVREIVKTGGGLTVPPQNPPALADALQGYFAAEIDRSIWREQVRAVAETVYDWEPIMDRLENVYQELVGL